MKKVVIAGLFLMSMIVVTSCTTRTCPTYAKAPIEHPEQEKL